MEMKSADDRGTMKSFHTQTQCDSQLIVYLKILGVKRWAITVTILLLEMLLSRRLHLSSEAGDKMNVPCYPPKPRLEMFDLNAAVNETNTFVALLADRRKIGKRVCIHT